jgi:CheY-like chemotaxis protein
MIFFFSQAETFIVPENMKDQTMENVHEVPVYQLSRSAFVLRMATGVLLVNLLVFALSFLSLRQSRFNYVQRAAVTTNNLSLMLEQNIDGSIDKIDVVLEAAVEEFGHRFARDAIAGEGTITIKTSAFAVTEQFIREHGFGKIGMHARIAVSDTGCGMKEETKKNIFEPFFTTKEVGKGTGLGLSIVYGIIKQHNGYIYACSEKDKGTTFNICLPMADNPPKTAYSAQRTPSIFRGNETLLLAEDDATLNDLHRELLEEAGYTVITTDNGEEALEKFMEQNNRIDLLILDAIMPKLNGKRVLDSARTVKPGINALFVSGYPADVLHEADMLQEDVEILRKPIIPNILLMKIRELLDSRNRN